MIQKPDAIKVRDFALAAITNLSSVLNLVNGKMSHEEYLQIKKTVGLSIGRIQTDILDLVARDYPELDDLK